MAAMTPETVNDETARVVRRHEMDGDAATANTPIIKSMLMMIAPIVKHVAPWEKDSLMNAVVGAGAAAASDSFRSVAALVEGFVDARVTAGRGSPFASRTKP
jgi:hypothetical protein